MIQAALIGCAAGLIVGGILSLFWHLTARNEKRIRQSAFGKFTIESPK